MIRAAVIRSAANCSVTVRSYFTQLFTRNKCAVDDVPVGSVLTRENIKDTGLRSVFTRITLMSSPLLPHCYSATVDQQLHSVVVSVGWLY